MTGRGEIVIGMYCLRESILNLKKKRMAVKTSGLDLLGSSLSSLS